MIRFYILLIYFFVISSVLHSQCPTIVPVVNDTCIIGTGSVDISASGSTGNYAWYDALIGGNIIGTGSVINSGVISSNTNFYVAAQVNNNTLEFDGNNDRVAIQNFSYNSTTITELTVEAWVKTTETNAQIIASFDRSEYWRLGISSTGATTGRVSWNINTNVGFTDIGGVAAVNDGQWHHVVGVYDNGVATIYVDGQVDVSVVAGATIGSGATRFGFVGVGSEASTYNGSQGPNHYFDGEIDEFRIWSEARSQIEIQNNMNSCLLGTEPNLDLYYQFNDGVGSAIVTDVVGGSNGNLLAMNTTNAWNLNSLVIACSGCESARSTLQVLVNNSNSLNISGGSNDVCISGSQVLDAGAGFDSYDWNDGSTSQTVNTSLDGYYSVLVSLGTCYSEDSLYFSTVGGAAQSSFLFDGTNDYINVDNFYYESSSISELSVEAWVKTTDGTDQIIGSYDRSEYWRLGINGDGAGTGQISWNLMTSAGILDFGSTQTVNDGNWHHIVGTYKNGLAKIYIDGVLDNSASKGTTIGSGAKRYGFIGTGSEATTNNGARGPNNYFNGEIDGVKVWSKELTLLDIREGMCKNNPVPDVDLDFVFHFNEGGGSYVYSIGSDIHGRVRNANLFLVWQESTAPIADNSSYLYTNSWVGQTLNLVSCVGDEIIISNISGTLDGLHLYVVEEAPNYNAGLNNYSSQNYHYGIFLLDGSNATYDIEYKYANHPLVNQNEEVYLSLFDRSFPNTNTWVATNSEVDTIQKSVYLSTQSSLELILEANYIEWTGNVNTDWNINGNWSTNTLPTLSNNVIIPNVLNQPILDMDRAVKGLSIEALSSVDIDGFELDVYGDLDHSGTLISNNGTLKFSSSTENQKLVTNQTLLLDNLIIDNPNLVENQNGRIELKNTLDVLQGSFETNDSLILISDAILTARIGEITGVGVTGEIEMQRYIDAGETYWRFFSSAVQGATIEDYQGDFVTSGYAGSDFPFFPFTSVYTYDEGVGYVAAASASQVIQAGQGVMVWSGDTITGTQPFVVDYRGVPNQGDINIPIDFTAIDGWNLVGNPYASTIDWDSPDWVKQNMGDAVYILNPDTEQYATYINGASANGGSPLIASQQAFWVYSVASNPILTAKESVKSPVDQAFFKSTHPLSPGMHIVLSKDSLSDESVLRHVDGATDFYEYEYDAKKIYANWDGYPHISIVNTQVEDFTVYSFDKLEQEWSLPLRAVVFEDGFYDLNFTDIHELDVPCMILEDLYTGIEYPIEQNSTISVFLSDTTWAPRFVLHLGKDIDVNTENVSCFGDSNGSVEINFDSDVDITYTLDAAIDQFGVALPNSILSLNQLGVGTYNLMFDTLQDLCATSELTFTISQPLPLSISETILHEENGQDGEIEIIIVGGTAPYDVIWSNGDSTNLTTNLVSGNYNLSISDQNNCEYTETIWVGNLLNIETKNSVSNIYYNSISNSLILDGFNESELILYNVQGQEIELYSIKRNQSEIKLPLSIANGTYIAKGGMISYKFIVNH